MSIALACLHCHAKMQAPDAAAGRQVRCPRCGQALTVPDPWRAPVAALAMEPSAPPVPAVPVVARPGPSAGQPAITNTPPPSGGRMPRWAWIALGGLSLPVVCLVVVLIVLATSSPAAPAKVTTKELTAAWQHWQGQQVSLTGTIRDNRDGKLVFHEAGQDLKIWAYCTDAAKAKVGELATVEGQLAGKEGYTLKIVNCKLMPTSLPGQSEPMPTSSAEVRPDPGNARPVGIFWPVTLHDLYRNEVKANSLVTGKVIEVETLWNETGYTKGASLFVDTWEHTDPELSVRLIFHPSHKQAVAALGNGESRMVRGRCVGLRRIGYRDVVVVTDSTFIPAWTPGIPDYRQVGP
jgi:hypothetical protein